MEIGTITLLMFGSMIALLLLGLPLAFVTGLIAVVFALGLFGPAGLQLIASRIFSFMNEYVLVSVPMFILMASLMERSGVAKDLFDAMRVWAGRLPGGLAIQTMVAATIMGAMTGIIGGEIVLLGLIALPQMLRLGYDKKLAIGTICAGGSLGTMIPPSIVLVIYGLTVNVPIGDLFTANIVPGLMLSAVYMLYIFIRCQLNPGLGPPAPLAETNLPLRQKLATLKGLLLPLLVMASVWLGYAVTRLANMVPGLVENTLPGGVFLAGMVVTAVANLDGHKFNRPGALIRGPGIILLVPGSLGFRSLNFVFERDVMLSLDTAFAVITALIALVAGILFGNLLVSPRRNL